MNSGTNTADTAYTLDPAGNRTNVTVTGVTVPTFSINSVSVTEGASATVTVTKSGGATGSLTVSYTSSDGTATAGNDYAATGTQTLTFLAGDATKTITIPTTDDMLVEGTENFTVTLSNASAGSQIGTGTGTVTINDNDTATSFAVSATPAVTEGGNLIYTVTKTGNLAANVTYATADGAATAGSDYTAATGTLVFASGDTTKTITVATTDDGAIEPAETVLVNLSGATNGATISTAQGSGTINDNDATGFAISAAPAVTEGGNLVYTVTKTGPVAADVSFATADGTATAGSDYTASSETLSFLAGDTTKTITVATIDDTAVESAETVLVNLSAPTNGATITTAQGSGTINDNDVPPTSFAISAAPAVTEGGTLVYTVTKTGGAAADVSYGNADGTATAGSDYTATSGTLSFLAGDTTKTIGVPTINDSVIEPAETVLMNLSAPTNSATITTGQGSGTINDNDATSFAIGNAAAATEGGNLVYTVTKTGSGTASVSYATADGTATAGSDYTAGSGTLNFLATDTTKTITVPTIDDTLAEPAETVLVNLSAPTGGSTVTTAQGSGTINDNDSTATLAIGNASAAEGSPLTFTVTRSGNTTIAASAKYATANGSATSGSDYTAKSGTVSFAAGQTSQTISVTTTNDTTVEADETLTVKLSTPSANTTITTATGIGTIVNNDTWSSTLYASSTTSCVNGVCTTKHGYLSGSLGILSPNAFNGFTITGVYDVNSTTLNFVMSGTSPPNGGWNSITVPGVGTLNRTAANFSGTSSSATWSWSISATVTNGTITIK